METAHLPNGTLLQGGKYRIVRFIGSGGFGCTYEGEHTMLQRRVAIKEFFVKDFCDRDNSTSHITVSTSGKKELVDKLKGKFLEEARATSRMQHPNIVKVYDVFEENGAAYYVMDYIDGPSLEKLVKENGPLPEHTALKYIRQVADALGYVHGLNRLHLDLKPGNIMTDGRGNAVLVDFGASKQYDEAGGENTSTLIGKTPGYAPIEQMGNTVTTFSPATDIYALGATLYKLLTGITPPGSNLLASGEELAPLPSNITTSTANAVSMAMKTARKDRPQNVSDFISLLDSKEENFKEKDSKEEDVKSSAPIADIDNADEETIFDGEHGKPELEQQKTDSETTIASEIEAKSDSASKTEQPKRKKSRKGWKITAIVFAVLVLSFVVIAIIDSSCPRIYSVPVSGQVNGYDYVDLGLSVMWATCNVGAYLPSGYGDSFAWGETSIKSEYTKDNSVTYGKNIGDIAGDVKYDVANAIRGGSWRMPTSKEMDELTKRCTWKWRKLNGVKGYLVTGPNGKSIFLPATDMYEEGGSYWTSSPTSSNGAAYVLWFEKDFFEKWSRVGSSSRYSGHTIRSVIANTTSSSSQTSSQTSTLSATSLLTTTTSQTSTQTSSSSTATNNTSSSTSYSESATTQQGSNQTTAQTTSTSSKPADHSNHLNGHEYVDLGLSVMWATCNVGASSPSDYGNYYAWGETKTKSEYSQTNSVMYGKAVGNITGNVQYDAARANWDGTWRMPTENEFNELVSKCTLTWITRDGHKGYLITGPNGNSIFLPAAGWCNGSYRQGVNKYGRYWSATTYANANLAYYLYFYQDHFNRYWNYRYYGQTIRPVME